MTLRVLSLFSGAGGADLALEAAGLSVAALCEIEPHARAVLREHWPDVPLHGDVQTLDGTQYRGKVDIVVGGSPCQDLSVAGKRAGLSEGSGTRSSLFHDQVRIWQESQATYLIWENVKGAFSSSQGADFAAVLSAIVGRTIPVRRDGWSNAGVVCGPTAVAAWRLLDLQHFGVPQRRERIVVLASRAGGVDPAEVLAVSQSVSRDTPPRFQAREGAARDVAPRPDSQSALAIDLYNQSVSADGVTHTIRAMNAGEGIPHTLTYDAPVGATIRTPAGSGSLEANVAVQSVLGVIQFTPGNLVRRAGPNPSTDGVSQTLGAFTQGDQAPHVVMGPSLPTGFSTTASVGYVHDIMPTLPHLTGLNCPGAQMVGVLDVAIPIDTRNATRTTDKSEQNRQGTGIGKDGDPSPTLTGLFTPAVLTYDARGNGNGSIVNTLAGDHQNRVTDYTALVVDGAVTQYGPMAGTLSSRGDGSPCADRGPNMVVQPTLAFKIRGGVEVDSAGKSAGKGYLGSEELAFTLGVSQDQHIHQPAFRMVAFGEYAEDGTASAIKARDFKDATDLAVAAPGVPRRLMPIETERLMGWPDSWTRWGVNEKGVRYELADTPRYKLCGNGIGREWMEWVAVRLMEAEDLTSTTPRCILEA